VTSLLEGTSAQPEYGNLKGKIAKELETPGKYPEETGAKSQRTTEA